MSKEDLELKLYQECYPDSNIKDLKQTINYNHLVKFLFEKIAELQNHQIKEI
jgi:hypothetical protein